jgi:tRNA(Ile)-lysidine synthetase-like protein
MSAARDPVDLVVAAVRAAMGPLLPATFGIACSGGADSLVLADAAALALGSVATVLLHVDHGLSEGSAAIGERVVAWARGRGLAAVVRRVEVERCASIEAAARQARYRALGELADQLGLVAIATAHTARDQAETVLLRILRGTGVAGLAGIAASRARTLQPLLRPLQQPLLRPLLAVDRATIDDYAAARCLPVWDDPMNADLRFARARVRRQLMPRLRQENPAIEEALRRLASHAAEWAEVLDVQAVPLAERLRASELVNALPAVRKRALALALIHRGLGFEAVHLEALDALMCEPARGTVKISLPGAVAVRQYDELRIQVGDGGQGDPQERAEARIPDEVADPGRFSVRRWRAGDRMRPARLGGRSKKLSDLFGEAKLPRALRATAQVVCRRRDDSIVWVEYLGFAHEITSDTAPGLEPELGSTAPGSTSLSAPVPTPNNPAEKVTFSKSKGGPMLQPVALVPRLTERKP